MIELAPTAVLEQALARHGLSLDHLRCQAKVIILFGSRAAGCARSTSDWDLLCIGPGRSRRLSGLDLVWLDPAALDTTAWLGGDLAGHIAAHGVWLEGAPCWDLGALDFAAAAHRKEARLARALRALTQSWDLLGPAYQRKHATLLRRDAQRCLLLQRGIPIPPSAKLDDVWAGERSRDWFPNALRSLGATAGLALALSSRAAEPEEAARRASSSPPI
jgi:hypothetical protein